MRRWNRCKSCQLHKICRLASRVGYCRSTTDFGDQAIQETVKAACTIANNTSEDEFAGLIDPEFIARQVPDLDLYHPWDVTPEDAIKLAVECENIARAYDKRITNSQVCTDGTAHIAG